MKRAALAGLFIVTMVVVVRLAQPPAPQTIKRRIPAAPATAVERGKVAYERYGCGMCHGADGTTGVANLNSETEEKIPAVIYVKEAYKLDELRDYILKGNQHIGKTREKGPTPPYRMPAGHTLMTRSEAHDLAQYLFSLYRESEGESWK